MTTCPKQYKIHKKLQQHKVDPTCRAAATARLSACPRDRCARGVRPYRTSMASACPSPQRRSRYGNGKLLSHCTPTHASAAIVDTLVRDGSDLESLSLPATTCTRPCCVEAVRCGGVEPAGDHSLFLWSPADDTREAVTDATRTTVPPAAISSPPPHTRAAVAVRAVPRWLLQYHVRSNHVCTCSA